MDNRIPKKRSWGDEHTGDRWRPLQDFDGGSGEPREGYGGSRDRSRSPQGGRSPQDFDGSNGGGSLWINKSWSLGVVTCLHDG
jgi:hypothetical protein